LQSGVPEIIFEAFDVILAENFPRCISMRKGH